MRWLAGALLIGWLSSAAAGQGAEGSADQARKAMQRAVAFLLQDQNADGSWGSPRGASNTFTGPFWSNPETHRSWTVATTGLCCMALLQAGNSPEVSGAEDRGIDYVLDNALLKRPSDWDLDHNWGYIYGLNAVARVLADGRYAGTPREARLRAIGQALIERLSATQSLSGGWGYYDFDLRGQTPEWATSFMTAATLLALHEAQELGLQVDERVIDRAVRAVRRCRLPSGAYTYSVEAVPDPRNSEWIDYFFDQHRFLDVARKRPIPHEAYYFNSGYFYFFGHYYAAGVIGELPAEDRQAYWPRLRREIIKTQEDDGSMFDFLMHSYHKPYGTAYGLLALQLSLADEPGES
jgi:hypothetical protein